MDTEKLTFKALLEKYGITAYRLAMICGISKQTTTNWNNGSRKPPEWALRMIDCYLERELKKDELEALTLRKEKVLKEIRDLVGELNKKA